MERYACARQWALHGFVRACQRQKSPVVETLQGGTSGQGRSHDGKHEHSGDKGSGAQQGYADGSPPPTPGVIRAEPLLYELGLTSCARKVPRQEHEQSRCACQPVCPFGVGHRVGVALHRRSAARELQRTSSGLLLRAESRQGPSSSAGAGMPRKPA